MGDGEGEAGVIGVIFGREIRALLARQDDATVNTGGCAANGARSTACSRHEENRVLFF